jgi:hypothetical protein
VVEIFKVIKRTSGGFHSWCDSSVGLIRKPNNKLPVEEVKIPVKEKWWQRLWKWLKKIFTLDNILGYAKIK